MNRGQRFVLTITFLLAAIAGLYPPWRTPTPYGTILEYRFLFAGLGNVALAILLTEWGVVCFLGLTVFVLISGSDNLPSEMPPKPARRLFPVLWRSRSRPAE